MKNKFSTKDPIFNKNEDEEYNEILEKVFGYKFIES